MNPPSRTLIRPLFWAAVGPALAFAFGCSHQQEPAPTPAARTAVVDGPRRAAPAPKAAPAEPPAVATRDTSKDPKDTAVYFDFDSALLRDDARPVLQQVATMARTRGAGVRIEGNCDEVGTIEYNLALGEHRAMQAKDYLTHLGVTPTKIHTVSYGSQRPRATGHDDGAHAENRRDDLTIVR